MADDALKNYFRSQQASLQWSPVLRALAAELEAHSDNDALRQMFSRVGQRFATDMALEFKDAQSLGNVAECLNDFWARINWGWVRIREERDGIHVQHCYAPLAEAFGDESLPWNIGLLEGFYTTVFKQLGAGETAAVRGVDGSGGDMRVELLLTV